MVTSGFWLGVPVVWFTVVVDYCRRGEWLRHRLLAAVWASPLVSFVAIFTSPADHLCHASSTIQTEVVGRPSSRQALSPTSARRRLTCCSRSGSTCFAGLLSTQERLFSDSRRGCWPEWEPRCGWRAERRRPAPRLVAVHCDVNGRTRPCPWLVCWGATRIGAEVRFDSRNATSVACGSKPRDRWTGRGGLRWAVPVPVSATCTS